MACWVTFQGCSSICLAACVAEEGDCEVCESVLGSVRVWSRALTAFVALSVYSWLLKHMQETAVTPNLHAGLTSLGLDLHTPAR